MKKSLLKIAVCATAVACVFTMSACTGETDPDDKGNSGGDQKPQTTFAQQQITLAKNTYDSFYAKDEMFTSQSAKSAVAVALADEGDEENGISFADVSSALSEYKFNKTGGEKMLFNSYVADIFSYSQVQTSIINEFGEEALTDVYALTYENVDWSSDTTGQGNWIKETKLLSATFVGADIENGKVYCAQSHKSNGVLVMANLEYYYNNDNDMGVTTLNWHSNGTFEYHYCSAGTFENLAVFGSYDQNGDITLRQFIAYRQDGQLQVNASISTSDIQLVYDYVLSEVTRINGTIDDLKTQNGRQRELDGTEDVDGEEAHVGVCSVNFDFEILERMLIK